jgi:hypothetical protein
MSRNGSGVYSLPAGNPVVTNTAIASNWANTTMTDLATAMTGSVAADGQTPMTGALNMNNNKISSLADGTLSADATTLSQVNTAIATAIATAGATYLLKASNLSDVANATTARGNLTAAKSGANSDITSLTGLTTPLTVAQGGTGAATLTANNVLLGNGTSAPQAVAPSTSGNVLTSNGTTWVSSALSTYPLTSGTTQASTSGTSIDFTSLPSWVKRVTVMFNGVSTNGSSIPQIQLGTGSTTYTTTNYLGSAFSSSLATTNFNSGALISPNNSAAILYYGSVIISTLGSNIWVFQGCLGRADANANFMGGQIELAATLTAVRITTVNGTDAFDAGSINILYE